MSSKKLKWWIAAFVGFAVIAGYVASRKLNSGQGVEEAFETLRKTHHETGVLDPKVVKLRLVREVGGEARYYTISFKDNHGASRRAVVKCTSDEKKYTCDELWAQEP